MHTVDFRIVTDMIKFFDFLNHKSCEDPFCVAMNKSKIYAKNIFGIDLEDLKYLDKTRYYNDVPCYIPESYPIQISFKTGAIHKIGNVSLTTLKQEVKNSRELTDEINGLINRFIRSSCVGSINNSSPFKLRPDLTRQAFHQAMNKSEAYAKSIFEIDLAKLKNFAEAPAEVPAEVRCDVPERQIIHISFKTGAEYKIGNIFLRGSDGELKNSRELTNEINVLINKFIRTCCIDE